MSKLKEIETIKFTPSFYEKEFTPPLLESTVIRVFQEEDAQFVQLHLEVGAEVRTVIGHACACHYGTLIDGIFIGLEIGFEAGLDEAASELSAFPPKSHDHQ